MSFTLQGIRDNIQEWRGVGYSWRDIVAMPEYEALSFPTIRRIALGIEPGNKVRKQLGLPPACTVIVMGGDEIPPGAQVIRAELCACGQWYVSNHPARKRCFLCSPFRGRKEKKC